MYLNNCPLKGKGESACLLLSEVVNVSFHSQACHTVFQGIVCFGCKFFYSFVLYKRYLVGLRSLTLLRNQDKSSLYTTLTHFKSINETSFINNKIMNDLHHKQILMMLGMRCGMLEDGAEKI